MDTKEISTDDIIRLTENKGSARKLLQILDELHSADLAEKIEQASNELGITSKRVV